jgi:hypothetical protein
MAQCGIDLRAVRLHAVDAGIEVPARGARTVLLDTSPDSGDSGQ